MNNYLTKLGDNVLTGAGPMNSSAAFGTLFSQLFNYAILAGSLLVFMNMILGGLAWIQSNGEKDKLEKARKQITNSIIGLVILVSIWTIYFLITADILGIFGRDANGSPIFNFPSLFGT